MKRIRLTTLAAMLVLLAAFLLVACDDGEGVDPTSTLESTATSEPTARPTEEPTATPSATEIAWEDVPALLATGEVETVFQNHALDVEIWMKDGSKHHVIEPGIIDIFTLVQECGAPCEGLMLATE